MDKFSVIWKFNIILKIERRNVWQKLKDKINWKIVKKLSKSCQKNVKKLAW
jgi:hypothetical protein